MNWVKLKNIDQKVNILVQVKSNKFRLFIFNLKRDLMNQMIKTF